MVLARLFWIEQSIIERGNCILILYSCDVTENQQSLVVLLDTAETFYSGGNTWATKLLIGGIYRRYSYWSPIRVLRMMFNHFPLSKFQYRGLGWVVWFLWHINLCRLFKAKSIFIQIISSISNNSIVHEYTVELSKTFLFQAIQFIQTVIIQFSINIDLVYTQLNAKQFSIKQFSLV